MTNEIVMKRFQNIEESKIKKNKDVFVLIVFVILLFYF